MKSKGLNIVSLFTGAGGLEIAACSTGKVRRIVSTDSNAVFLSTTEHNMPIHFPKVEHRSLVADVRELKPSQLTDLMEGSIDVVMGGPPCDDFARWGRQHGMTGRKGPLIYEFKRLTNELSPAIFLFENVPNLVQQFRQDFKQYLAEWTSDGWHCQWKLLDARDYGAPTLRKRVILIGCRSEKALDRFRFPPATHEDRCEGLPLFQSNLQRFVTVADVFRGLPDVNTSESVALGLANHDGRKHRPSTIEHIRSVPPGVQIGKSRRYRPPWDGLCWSLTAGLDDSTKSYIHPHFHREMSVREYARIHCFPDSWFFCGTLNNGIKQVANSVPIPLGAAVWRQIHGLLGTRIEQTHIVRSI
ncbi:MAG: DNA cytosine methyltransferase [Lentisphaerae bacterium]|nr:DNA cytosine methyltransferase [Lentisphaerota bacterium]